MPASLRLAAGLLLLLAVPALAQGTGAERPDPLVPQGANMDTPPTWTVRMDPPRGAHPMHRAPTVGADSTADLFFVNMTPGWHITTGPAAILYHPASTAAGAFRAEAKIYLFDPDGRNEAFGLLVGGRDLDADAQSYDYFLIRTSGEFLVKRRTGGETTTLVPWTAHGAIVGHAGEGPVANTLAVEAGDTEVAFVVNGATVATLPRADVNADGIVGLRVNHALNLHVETFAVTAPDGSPLDG